MSQSLNPRRIQAILENHANETYWHDDRLYVLDHSVRAFKARMHYLTEVRDVTTWDSYTLYDFLGY